MFKAVLIITVMGIGKGGDQGASFNAIPFQSMAQCKEAVTHLEKEMKVWHYGKDKSNTVPVLKRLNCFSLTPESLDIPAPAVTLPESTGTACAPTTTIVVKEPMPQLRKHKRWDQ